uniref:Uncharacterized protein n=1 Tax=Rhizophora mucronata TaxID=61149 RepID=A0A2P2IUN8_RHIMU
MTINFDKSKFVHYITKVLDLF